MLSRVASRVTIELAFREARIIVIRTAVTGATRSHLAGRLQPFFDF